MDLVENLLMIVHHNLYALLDIIYVMMELVHMIVKIMTNSVSVQMIKCINAKTKLVQLPLLIVELELLVTNQVWLYVQIKLVHSVNYNVEFLFLVMMIHIFVLINLVYPL